MYRKATAPRSPHLSGSDEKAAARKQHSCQLQKGERHRSGSALLLFAAVVKAAHTAADGKISCPEQRTQIGQVKYGLSAEPGLPDRKGEKDIVRRKSRRQCSAVCGHRPFSARRAARERWHTEKPAPKDTTPLRSGRTRNGWRGSMFAAGKCLPQAAAAQDSTPRAEGCARSPFSTNRQGSSHHNKVQRIQLAYFLQGKGHGRPQSRCCARAVVIVAGHQKTGQRHEYREIAHGPSHGAPQWERTTLRNATARSPCKDEISFLSVTVSSVLPKIAAAVFFTSVISIKKAACSVKKYAESVFPIRRSTACAPLSTAPDSSAVKGSLCGSFGIFVAKIKYFLQQ